MRKLFMMKFLRRIIQVRKSERSILKPILLHILFLFSVFCMAQQASSHAYTLKIDDAAISLKSEGWYKNQSSVWRNEVARSKKNTNAWFNYYKASRYANYKPTSREINPVKQQELNIIIQEMSKAIPSSFEYNFCKYWNSDIDTSLFPYLQKAYEIDPNRTETYDDFVSYYELTANSKKKNEFCKLLAWSGNYNTNVMEYNYNVLMSLEKNAILITNGDKDTYPIWILQSVYSFRADIKVLNINLLKTDYYRERKFKEQGIISPEVDFSDKTNFLKLLGEKNKNKAIYFALTIKPDIIKSLKNNLFITGLAAKYNFKEFDNIKQLINNWEEKFKKENLSDILLSGRNYSKDNLSSNYILPMLLIYKYYYENNMTSKAEELKAQIITMSSLYGKQNLVNQFFDRIYKTKNSK